MVLMERLRGPQWRFSCPLWPGLPEHHDVRRAPATYERIIRSISGCRVNMHGTITRPMLERSTYLEKFISFWGARPEIVRIWISLYTPQKGESSPEMLTAADRDRVAEELPRVTEALSEAACERGHLARSPGATGQSKAMHVLANVY